MKARYAIAAGLILNGRYELSRHAPLSIFGRNIQACQPRRNVMQGFELMQNQQANACETASDQSYQCCFVFIRLGGKLRKLRAAFQKRIAIGFQKCLVSPLRADMEFRGVGFQVSYFNIHLIKERWRCLRYGCVSYQCCGASMGVVPFLLKRL